ncbi:putative 6-phosphogluconolactonase [Lachnellula subtilissima]|uniref:Putative 6-phosphogluconolactonase n=1 Tax=Lachnellula subtilissima TaxID=602034 RepID=A0A8H8UB15_9HELO|nr:putative 6-phosphogluconolactonase [Lachnellula subtilissima]
MLIPKSILYAMSIATCKATKLYVSSYDGNITTMHVTEHKAVGIYNQSQIELKPIAINNGCAPSPSWLQLHSNTLFCADEGNTTPNKSLLVSFKTGPNGTLLPLSKLTTLNGNVNSAIYGNGSTMALAEYSGSAITTVNLKNTSALTILQSLNFIFDFDTTRPGPKPQQSVPRPHQILFDPTEMFMLCPDLGADIIRVFHAHPANKILTEQKPIKVSPGSGPRHATFYTSEECGAKKTYLYLVTEISNSLLGYEVFYKNMTLSFNKIHESSTFGSHFIPVDSAASEILVTPNNKHLIISSRNDTYFLNSTNPDPANKTSIVSDTLLTYSINPCNGSIALTQKYPAGGSFPRSMSLNRKGDLLAVALQQSSRVVMFRRNATSGNITEIAGSVAVNGELTDVVWDEPTDDGVYARALGVISFPRDSPVREGAIAIHTDILNR